MDLAIVLFSQILIKPHQCYVLVDSGCPLLSHFIMTLKSPSLLKRVPQGLSLQKIKYRYPTLCNLQVGSVQFLALITQEESAGLA